MPHVLQVLFLSVFILQVVMHGDLRQSEILIEQDFKIWYEWSFEIIIPSGWTQDKSGVSRRIFRGKGNYQTLVLKILIISFRPSHDICNIQPRKHIKRYFNSNIHRNWSWLWLIGCYFHGRWTDSAIFMTRSL